MRRSCKCGSAELRTRITYPANQNTSLTTIYDRSRKVKEVDFGFSFGLGPLGAETEAPSHPSSQPTAAVAEPPSLQPSSSASQDTQQQPPPLPPSNGLLPSPSQSAQQRPGSARSTRRQRPSTFDIPTDEDPEQRRTSKRRRIGTCLDDCIDLYLVLTKLKNLPERYKAHLLNRTASKSKPVICTPSETARLPTQPNPTLTTQLSILQKMRISAKSN